MAQKIPLLRVAGPTLLVSLLLFAACTFAAVFLYRAHARTAERLAEDLDSRRIAGELETTLKNLAALVKEESNQVETLHKQVAEILEKLRELMNTAEEQALGQELEESFAAYVELWWEHGSLPRPNPALDQLEKETVPMATRARQHHAKEIEVSEEALRETVSLIAWGLVVVGSIGSLGGIILGYGVARAIRHSFYRLSVSIRDASDKLRHELPTVTLKGGEDSENLHEQMQQLIGQIEETVQRLQQREHEVLRAEQMAAVGQLAAGVAHELRNPLTAVKMLVQTSREDFEARGIPAEDLHIIEKEIRRLESSLQTFLDFARPPRMEQRRIRLASVVEEALALTSGRARKQKVILVYEEGGQSVQLEGDPDQLRQLLVNLLLNSLDVLPRGGQITIQSIHNANGSIELQVRDTGAGIDAHILPRLFEPFVSAKETGLGLGLVVSRRIAEEHGGTLTGSNLPGGGACFTLRLPAQGGTERESVREASAALS